MPTKKKTENKRVPSYGTLTLVETLDGDLRLHVEVDQNEFTPEVIMSRIRAAISGLAYFYNHEAENIESHGRAYIEGIETGLDRADFVKGKEAEGSSSETNQTMGFFSK